MSKLLSAFFTFLATSAFATHPNLDKIPSQDKQKLEVFFNYLMHNSIIGYSLCGEKPVSMETFPSLTKIPLFYAVSIFAKYQGYSILWNGWKTWTLYSHLFPSENFILRFIEKYNTLICINKKITKKVIEENIDLFQKYSNSQQTPSEFLEAICYPHGKEYMICSNDNHILLGILLGYGRNNAIAFSKRSYIQKLESFNLYNTNDSLNYFMNPGFLVINNGTNDKENDTVKKKLRLAKRNIQSIFKDETYLTNFISQFTK